MSNAIGIGIPMVSIALGGGGASPAPFIFDAITTADAEVFQMPFRTTSTVNAEVDWGDGTSDTVTSSAEAVHTYATAGTHTITVTGTINGWSYYYANQDGVTVNTSQMGNISQWGSFVLDEDVTFYNCSNLTVTATDGPTTTDAYSFGYWFANCSSLTSIDISSWDFTNMTATANMFRNTGLVSIDLSGLDFSTITNLSNMFSSCSSLESVITTGLDLTNAERLSFMFDGCNSLTTLDLSELNLESVIDINYMFRNCSSLTSIDLSSLTGNISAQLAFRDATSLTSIDLSGGVSFTFVNLMFDGCTSLVSVDMTGCDLNSVTNTYGMFQDCSSLTTITGNEGFGLAGLTGGYSNVGYNGTAYMFRNCVLLTALDTSAWTLSSNLQDMHQMFYKAKSLTTIDASNWDVSSVTDMSYTFSSNSDMALTTLNLSGWNAGSLTNLTATFAYCRNLPSIDVSGMNTSNVTSMNSTFYNCRALGSLDVTNWNTDNVTDMEYTFYNLDGSSSPIVGLNGWNTGNVAKFRRTFQNCKFRDLDISGWDTSSVTNTNEFSIQLIYSFAEPRIVMEYHIKGSSFSNYKSCV